MRDLSFYLTNMPPLPVPHLDVDILYYRQIDAADLPSLLILSSRSPEPQKRDRMAMVGGGAIRGIKIPVQEHWLRM